MTVKQSHTPAHAGDWLEVHGPAGKPSRRGQVVEVLGGAGHERYRVRWDEKHESIFFPPAGVAIRPRTAWAPARRPSGRPVRG
jgi:Domain of unknown function (DUF1918)